MMQARKSWEELRAEGRWSLASTMMGVYRWFLDQSSAAYAAAGWPGLGMGDVLFLAALPESGSRLTAVAEALQVTKQYVGRQAQDLVKQGLIRLENDPIDRRASLAVPTDKGHAFLATACAVRSELEARVQAVLGIPGVADLNRIMDLLGTIAAKTGATSGPSPELSPPN